MTDLINQLADEVYQTDSPAAPNAENKAEASEAPALVSEKTNGISLGESPESIEDQKQILEQAFNKKTEEIYNALISELPESISINEGDKKQLIKADIIRAITLKMEFINVADSASIKQGVTLNLLVSTKFVQRNGKALLKALNENFEGIKADILESHIIDECKYQCSELINKTDSLYTDSMQTLLSEAQNYNTKDQWIKLLNDFVIIANTEPAPKSPPPIEDSEKPAPVSEAPAEPTNTSANVDNETPATSTDSTEASASDPATTSVTHESPEKSEDSPKDISKTLPGNLDTHFSMYDKPTQEQYNTIKKQFPEFTVEYKDVSKTITDKNGKVLYMQTPEDNPTFEEITGPKTVTIEYTNANNNKQKGNFEVDSVLKITDNGNIYQYAYIKDYNDTTRIESIVEEETSSDEEAKESPEAINTSANVDTDTPATSDKLTEASETTSTIPEALSGILSFDADEKALIYSGIDAEKKNVNAKVFGKDTIIEDINSISITGPDEYGKYQFQQGKKLVSLERENGKITLTRIMSSTPEKIFFFEKSDEGKKAVEEYKKLEEKRKKLYKKYKKNHKKAIDALDVRSTTYTTKLSPLLEKLSATSTGTTGTVSDSSTSDFFTTELLPTLLNAGAPDRLENVDIKVLEEYSFYVNNLLEAINSNNTEPLVAIYERYQAETKVQADAKAAAEEEENANAELTKAGRVVVNRPTPSTSF